MSAIPNVPESVLNINDSNPDSAQQHLQNNKDAVANGDTLGVNGEKTNGEKDETTWQLHDAPVENQRPLKVIVIGAGYSGIYLGIRLPERLKNVDLVIYEKNPGSGGTW